IALFGLFGATNPPESRGANGTTDGKIRKLSRMMREPDDGDTPPPIPDAVLPATSPAPVVRLYTASPGRGHKRFSTSNSALLFRCASPNIWRYVAVVSPTGC